MKLVRKKVWGKIVKKAERKETKFVKKRIIRALGKNLFGSVRDIVGFQVRENIEDELWKYSHEIYSRISVYRWERDGPVRGVW